MLKAKTATARFKVAANKVQDFVGNIENLPKWATSFCLDLRTEGQDYIVKTPAGDMFFQIHADNDTGITDLFGGPSKDMMMRWPVRILDDGTGGSVLTFTNIQMPGMPDEIFEGQCAALDEEFENIRRHVEA